MSTSGDLPAKQSITLIRILKTDSERSYPFNVNTFRKYCWDNYQAESIEFWLAVDKFRECCRKGILSKPTMYINEVQEILNSYFREDGMFQVNIPSSEKRKVEESYQESLKSKFVNYALFDKAQEHVYHTLRQDVFPRFMRHVIEHESSLQFLKEPASRMQRKKISNFSTVFLLKVLENRVNERILDMLSALNVGILLVLLRLLSNSWLYWYLMFGFLMRTIGGFRLDPQAILVNGVLRPFLQGIGKNWLPDQFVPALPFRISEFSCLCSLICSLLLNSWQMYLYEDIILIGLIVLCLCSAILNISPTRLIQCLIQANDKQFQRGSS